MLAAAAAIWAIASSPEYRGGDTNPGAAFGMLPVAATGAAASGADQMKPVLAGALEEAQRSPLSSYPFAVAALATERDGDDVAARGLMLRAMQLRPRSPAIRVWLAYSFAKTGELTQAVHQAASLYELAPAMDSRISPMLAQIARSDTGRRAIVHALQGTPYLMAVVRAAPRGSLGPQALVQLLGTVDETQLDAAQARIVDEYLASNDYAGARKAWGHFLSDRSATSALIYDGTFEGRPGSAPFNWQLMSSGELQTDLSASGLSDPRTALRVERVGASPATAVRQMTVLEPGRYQLSHLMRFEGGASSSTAFAWQIQCLSPSTNLIATLPLADESPQSWKRKNWNIVVPTRCGFVQVELRSLPNDISLQSTVLVTDVRLTALP